MSHTFIRDNGAITTTLKDGTIVFYKPGADGQGTELGAKS